MKDAWQAGELDLSAEHEARGAHNTFELVASLMGPDGDQPTFEAIRSFYSQLADPEEKETDATETDELAESKD